MTTQVVTPARSFNIMMLINIASGVLMAALPVVTQLLPVLQGVAPKIYGVVAALLPFANLIAHKSTQPVAEAAPDNAPVAVPVATAPGAPVAVQVPAGMVGDAATLDAVAK